MFEACARGGLLWTAVTLSLGPPPFGECSGRSANVERNPAKESIIKRKPTNQVLYIKNNLRSISLIYAAASKTTCRVAMSVIVSKVRELRLTVSSRLTAAASQQAKDGLNGNPPNVREHVGQTMKLNRQELRLSTRLRLDTRGNEALSCRLCGQQGNFCKAYSRDMAATPRRVIP